MTSLLLFSPHIQFRTRYSLLNISQNPCLQIDLLTIYCVSGYPWGYSSKSDSGGEPRRAYTLVDSSPLKTNQTTAPLPIAPIISPPNLQRTHVSHFTDEDPEGWNSYLTCLRSQSHEGLEFFTIFIHSPSTKYGWSTINLPLLGVSSGYSGEEKRKSFLLYAVCILGEASNK